MIDEVKRAEDALIKYGYQKDNLGVYVLRPDTQMWRKLDVKDGGGWACFDMVNGEVIQNPYSIKLSGGLVVNSELSGTLSNPKVGSDYYAYWAWPDSAVAEIYENAFKIIKS